MPCSQPTSACDWLCILKIRKDRSGPGTIGRRQSNEEHLHNSALCGQIMLNFHLKVLQEAIHIEQDCLDLFAKYVGK